MEELIEYYSQILTSFGLSVDEEGHITHQFMGDEAALKVKNRALVMPSRKLLAKPLPDNLVVFHPLSENVARGGESEVLKTMRDVVELQVTFYLTALMRNLAHFAAGHGPKLSGRQVSYLKPLQDADDKFLKFLDNVIEASDVKGQNRIVKFFMTRSFSLNGKTHTRACVVKFPGLAQAADERKDKVFGVRIPRKKDRTLLINLMQILLDGYGLDDEYFSTGSSSNIAPYWDALLGAYLKLTGRINTVLRHFGKHIPDAQFVPPMNTKYIDTSDWENELVSMHRLRDTIPPLAFNTGVANDAQEETVVAEAAAPHAAAPTAAPVPQDTPPWETDAPAPQPAPAAPVQTDVPPHMQNQNNYPYGNPAQPVAQQPVTSVNNDPYSLEALAAAERQLQYNSAMRGYNPGGMIYNTPVGGYGRYGY